MAGVTSLNWKRSEQKVTTFDRVNGIWSSSFSVPCFFLSNFIKIFRCCSSLGSELSHRKWGQCDFAGWLIVCHYFYSQHSTLFVNIITQNLPSNTMIVDEWKISRLHTRVNSHDGMCDGMRNTCVKIEWG